MGRFTRQLLASQPFAITSLLLTFGFASNSLHAADLTVNSSSDVIASDGFCTLREAIINANNNNLSGSADCTSGESALTDIIRFDPAIDGSPIVLTRIGTNEDAANTGDLDITETVAISGNGIDATVIDGNGTDRVFHIQDSAEVQLLTMTVSNGGGVSSGAGVYVGGGRLTMLDARVSSNSIVMDAGNASGAGLHVVGNAFLTRVSVVGNEIDTTASEAAFGSGGGIYVGANGTLDMMESVVQENSVATVGGSARGGGLFLEPNSGASTGISSSIFSGNQVLVSGDGEASGGAISHQAGELGITRAMFVNNSVIKTSSEGSSAVGGAITSQSPLSMSDSTLSGNRVEGIVYAGGGGLLVTDSAILNNVTITQNAVQAEPTEFAQGGGVRVIGSNLELTNSLIADNTSTDVSPDCTGTITSGGYNLIGNNSDCTFTASTGDIVGDVNGGGTAVDPVLGTLAANGAEISIDGTVVPVLTHAPQPGSPAIDAADPIAPLMGGSCSRFDQTEETRPIDGDGDGVEICDIGSVEFREALIQEGGSGGASFGGSGGGGGALSPLFLLSLVGVAAWIRRGRLRA